MIKDHMTLLSHRKFPLWAVILALGILFFPLRLVSTSPDSAWYLSSALNIYHGNGYVGPDHDPIIIRGPVFPALIATSFYLFGPSVQAGMWVVRLFFVLNLLIVYVLGTKLYDRKIGFVASLMVLTSHLILRCSSRLLLDVVVPFFMLSFLYLVFIGFERRSYIYLTLAGLILGLAFLTKEMAIILIPLPLLVVLFIRAFRARGNFTGMLLLYLSFSAVVVLWGIYIYFATGNIPFILGGLVRKALYHPSWSVGPSQFSMAPLSDLFHLRAFYHFFSERGQGYLGGLAILMILSPWALPFYRAIKKSTPDIFMVLSAAVFFPIVIITVGMELRLGNLVYLFLLSYIIGANVLYLLASKVATFWGTKCSICKKFTPNSYLYAMLILIIGTQLLFSWSFLKRINFFYTKPFKTGGWHSESVGAIGQWMTENIPAEANVLCQWYWRCSLYFFDGGKHKIFSIPLIGTRGTPVIQESGISHREKARVVFLWKNRFREILMCVTEDDLLRIIKEEEIHCIIITPRRFFLSCYFDGNPNFEVIKEFYTDKGIVKIFKVYGFKPRTDFKTHVTAEAKKYIERLRLDHPSKYKRLMAEFFGERLGFTENDVEEMLSSHP